MTGFAEFFRAVHGDSYTPYGWQERLADQCANGAPPSAIAVPTGAGKTAAVDVLVWALGRQAHRPASERTVGVRIVWAIDRRILVDEVHEHTQRLAQRLLTAQTDAAHALHDVATRLARLSGGTPLIATRWRGGLDHRPERHGPLQPQVITSTVAQVGSRLLFRGYGVGEGSLAIEAGLAACDTTICLDEAHLAEPFRQTVDAIRRHRARTESDMGLPTLRHITITATPQRGENDVIGLEDADRTALGSRYFGAKRARLVEPESAGDADRARLLVRSILEYLRCDTPTVACVVNTVHRARLVFDTLTKELTDQDVDIALLIGPQRPADRRLTLERHREVLLQGKDVVRPLVCVATQTFEVGLDADVAALVTESASASALVQRLGRLNRRGDTVGQATIVRDEGRWLYAHDEPLAWAWLQSRVESDGTLDVSVAALDSDGTRPESQRVSNAPFLTTETVGLLAQTSPRPGSWEDPDVDVYLRGADSDPAADVAVCWRSDLRLDAMDEGAVGYREMLLDLAPPHTQELLTLSAASARALLAARLGGPKRRAAATRAALADADLESGMTDPAIPDVDPDIEGIPFLVLRREGLRPGSLTGTEVDSIATSALEPGDVVLLPTRTGGVDEHGLAPRADIANDVAPDLRPVEEPVPVRLTPEALDASLSGRLTQTEWNRVAAICRNAEAGLENAHTADAKQAVLEELPKGLRGVLSDHQGLSLLEPDALNRSDHRLLLRGIGPAEAGVLPLDERETFGLEREDLEALNEPSEGEVPVQASIIRAPLGRAWVLVPFPAKLRERDDRTSAAPPPTLDAHARAVHDELQTYADRLGLPERIAASLLTAARAHDHGKADRRIQAFYRRGIDLLGAPPIAKSEFGTRDPRTSRIAQDLSGLPHRLRHEIASVAALSGALDSGTLDGDHLDPDLALHLVATHHGRGRPVPNVPDGGNPPRRFKVDAGGVPGTATGDGRDGWADGAWSERFWQVIERYGPWGTAYLEALLVLADRTVSSRGS